MVESEILPWKQWRGSGTTIRNTFMGSHVARTQAGAAGIRNKGCPMGFPGALALFEALTPDQGTPDSAGWELAIAEGPGLCESLYYNFMSIKLWLSLHFQFWYKSSHAQITDVSHYWWLQCCDYSSIQVQNFLSPAVRKVILRDKYQWHSLAILMGLQSCHRSQAIIILGVSDDEACHYCQTGLRGLFWTLS